MFAPSFSWGYCKLIEIHPGGAIHPPALIFAGVRGPQKELFSRSEITRFQKMATLVYYRTQQLSRGF